MYFSTLSEFESDKVLHFSQTWGNVFCFIFSKGSKISSIDYFIAHKEDKISLSKFEYVFWKTIMYIDLPGDIQIWKFFCKPSKILGKVSLFIQVYRNCTISALSFVHFKNVMKTTEKLDIYRFYLMFEYLVFSCGKILCSLII